jgi:hypothetical protein
LVSEAAGILAERVSCGAGYKPFGEMTRADVESRAAELAAAAEVVAMAQRTAPVAAAWRGLAEEMEREGAATVADLDHGYGTALAERAGRLWVVPPGGSLLP